MISDDDTVDQASAPEIDSPSQVHDQRPAQVVAGLPALVGAGAALVVAVILIVVGSGGPHALTIVGVVVLLADVVFALGLVVVQPNESRVLILFGRYVGTVTEAGLWWVNPFTVFWRESISLRVRNFQSERIKVNDASGNPIEIAAVVVWRVTTRPEAVFDVEDFEQFVVVQSETAAAPPRQPVPVRRLPAGLDLAARQRRRGPRRPPGRAPGPPRGRPASRCSRRG